MGGTFMKIREGKRAWRFLACLDITGNAE